MITTETGCDSHTARRILKPHLMFLLQAIGQIPFMGSDCAASRLENFHLWRLRLLQEFGSITLVFFRSTLRLNFHLWGLLLLQATGEVPYVCELSAKFRSCATKRNSNKFRYAVADCSVAVRIGFCSCLPGSSAIARRVFFGHSACTGLCECALLLKTVCGIGFVVETQDIHTAT